MELGGVPLERVEVPLGGLGVSLWRAVQLERFVDVAALLGADAPPEPPYWMHLWPGALTLARRLAVAPAVGEGTRVLELGCGLGLPALVAARRGAAVVACDRQGEPLAVVARSAADNGDRLACVQMDWRAPALAPGFDLCLGADVAYDQDGAPALAASLASLVRPGGSVWLADSVNTARTTLADQLEARGFVLAQSEVTETEDGRRVWVRLIEARRR
ncbi:MAG TPA: methyltransferase domain-containing protein [Candidatus Dormibacteraeota bacterium]|nr:methyltransferase domain-containing protein [Candidatus Dormibacteraeota bacterium]